jgi:hypothetical protein
MEKRRETVREREVVCKITHRLEDGQEKSERDVDCRMHSLFRPQPQQLATADYGSQYARQRNLTRKNVEAPSFVVPEVRDPIALSDVLPLLLWVLQ